jgi:AcrR family transcriptional regulator
VTAKSAKGKATRERLVAVASELFAASGYEATSIESVLAKSAVSRGALYHHFENKEALFAAVLEAIEAKVAIGIVASSRGIADPVEALRAGCNAWLDIGRDAAVRQIVLVDAPSVVGWQKWRDIDARHGFGLLKTSLERAGAQGRTRAEGVDILAHMLLAALMELALVVSRASDPESALRSGRAALHDLIDKLLGPPARKAVGRRTARPKRRRA